MKLFPVQTRLPHVPAPTKAEVMAFVKEKLHGFEYRQAARVAKRVAIKEKKHEYTRTTACEAGNGNSY